MNLSRRVEWISGSPNSRSRRPSPEPIETPGSRPLVKATLKRLGREHGKPRKQARPAAVEALLAIRPEDAVTDPAGSVFGLSASQISRRIKAAGRMAGLGDGFSAHSPRVGMAQDLSAAGAELPELMTAGRCPNQKGILGG